MSVATCSPMECATCYLGSTSSSLTGLGGRSSEVVHDRYFGVRPRFGDRWATCALAETLRRRHGETARYLELAWTVTTSGSAEPSSRRTSSAGRGTPTISVAWM